jgi:hypothetical protein
LNFLLSAQIIGQKLLRLAAHHSTDSRNPEVTTRKTITMSGPAASSGKADDNATVLLRLLAGS